MPELNLAPRVRETSTSSGNGALTLAGAPPGFFPFSAVGSGAAREVPYLIEWGSGASAGAEWGIGTLNAAGTLLTRTFVLGHTPSTLRAGPGTTPVDLPGGTKTVSLAAIDTMAVAACPDLTQTTLPSPRADGVLAMAVGIGSSAVGDWSCAFGPYASARHPSSVVVGPGLSIGPKSATLAAGDGLVAEQCFAGNAASGAPFVFDGPTLALSSDAPYWIEMTAIACDAAMTQFRAIRRTVFAAAAGIVTQSADTVLTSTLATIPTVTLTVGSAGTDGRQPLHVSASSSGATAVDWRIFFRTMGL